MAKTLSQQEEDEARQLYEEFRISYPDQKNPSDINTPEKEAFLEKKGRDCINLMQRARKQGYEFTRL